MDIRLLYFDGCPNWQVTEQRLRSALAVLGRDEQVRCVLVETPEEADSLGFIGSPTILIEGHDPFARGHAQPGMACRVFATPNGFEGSPTIQQLLDVLARGTSELHGRPRPG